MHAPRLPRPHLGRDIVNNLRIGQVLAAEGGYLQVERGIVNQHEHIGLLAEQCRFGGMQVRANLAEVQQHGNDAHICHLAVVHENLAALGKHLVAAEARERRRGVALAQLLYQMRRVQITRRLACYQKIPHSLERNDDAGYHIG